MAVEQRLERMEEKLDKLYEIVSALAAVEEKIRSVHHRLGNAETAHIALNTRQEEIKDEIHELRMQILPKIEQQTRRSALYTGAITSVLTAVITAVLIAKLQLG